MADPQTLFRHKMPANAFFETVLLAKRWTGADALSAGIVQQLTTREALAAAAMETAQELARLGKNREVMAWMKEHAYGENASINSIHGPAYMLRKQSMYPRGPGKLTF